MSEKTIPRIAICMPTRDLVAAECMMSAMKLYGRFCNHFVATGQAEVMFLTDLGTLLPEMRNALVQTAIDQGATHVFWLDSDMTFPADTLERLLAHNECIVGAGYSQRKEPAKPVSAKDGIWVYTEEDSTGIEAVDFVGMGVMLVETEVYKVLPKPWHMTAYVETTGNLVGEDVYFCRKAQAIGAPTFIDHDLTKEIGHIGYRTFTYKDTLAARPELLRRQIERGGDTTSIRISEAKPDGA
jgi:hypothetical protein